MIESDVTSGTVSPAPHSSAELEQTAVAERELKRRGRRRLIGAGTLGLLGIVFLPMFFDTEPRVDKPNTSGVSSSNSGSRSTEINIIIPQREGLSALPPPVLPAPTPSAPTPQKAPIVEEPAVPPKVAGAESKGAAPAVVLGAAAVVVGAAIVGEKAGVEKRTADTIAAKPPVATPKPTAAPTITPTTKVTPLPAPPAAAVPPPVAKASTTSATTTASTNAPAAKPAASTAVTASPAAAVASSAGSFVVQLGAFSDEYNIRTLTERMKSGKLPVYAEKIQITSAGKPKTVTRLRVGPYPTMEKAKAISLKVKALGVTNTVVAK